MDEEISNRGDQEIMKAEMKQLKIRTLRIQEENSIPKRTLILCPRCGSGIPLNKCVICGHKILSMDDPKKTKRDTLSFQILDKWICGRCGVDIMARRMS